MTLATAQAVTRALVVCTPILWVAWDVFAELAFGSSATESVFLRTIGRNHHAFALAVGLAGVALYWHFFVEWGP